MRPKLSPSFPYQPLLLRILHGLTGLFLTAAILTAYWTYDTYDGRWGRIPLPTFPDIEGMVLLGCGLCWSFLRLSSMPSIEAKDDYYSLIPSQN